MALRRTGLRFTPTIYAGLTTSNVIADDIDVRAEVTPKVTAHGYGVNSGALSVGVSKATVTISPTVSAVAGGTINARTLDVEAMTRTPSTGSTATAKTTGSAGGLIGIDATRTTITHGGTVSSETIIAYDTKVSIGDNAILTGQGTEASPGEFALRAVNDIRAVDKISFVTGGALSGAGAYSTIKTSTATTKG